MMTIWLHWVASRAKLRKSLSKMSREVLGI